jgi:hypothetical protein
VCMMDDKYHPRSFEELAGDPTPVTLINEPVPADNVGVLAPRGEAKVVACDHCAELGGC